MSFLTPARLTPLALVLGTALFTGCVAPHVSYDYDSSATFSAYKTYDWYAASARAKGKSGGVENPLMDRRVRNAVERQLMAHGFKQEKAGEPDFLVTYYPVYQNRAVVTSTGIHTGLGWGWGFRPFGVSSQVNEVHHYQEGTIVLEIVDNKTNQLVWKAAAEGALSGVEDPEDAEEQVNKAVKEMLNRFPPASLKNH